MEERSTQVQMMAGIYRSAQSVIVDQGEEVDNSREAMDLVGRIGSSTHDFNHAIFVKLLITFRNAESSEARDQIFGLLVLSDRTTGITPYFPYHM